MLKIDYKFKPSLIFTIVYLLLIFLGIALTIIRWASQSYNLVVITPEINSHISNFSLTLMSYLGIGYTWLLSGSKFKSVMLLGLLFVVANLICETLITFLNTPDINDAVFGIFGALIAFLFLFALSKYGLSPIKQED